MTTTKTPLINTSREATYPPLLSLGGVEKESTVADIRADAVMHLSIGSSASYNGEDGLVRNLVQNPVDGEEQAAYDFTDGGMPLIGTVGEAGAYLDLGGKYMTIATPNPNFIQKIGRSNQSWWMAFGISTLDTSGGCSLFANQDAGAGGIYIKKQGNESSVISFKVGGSNQSAIPAYPYMPLGVDNFILYSWDGVSNTYTWHGRNGLKIVKPLTLPVDETTLKTTNFKLFSTYSGGTLFSAGTSSKCYSVMMGTGAITTDEEYEELRAFAAVKDNANYTPV